jgi:hypothetical protein
MRARVIFKEILKRSDRQHDDLNALLREAVWFLYILVLHRYIVDGIDSLEGD